MEHPKHMYRLTERHMPQVLAHQQEALALLEVPQPVAPPQALQ